MLGRTIEYADYISSSEFSLYFEHHNSILFHFALLRFATIQSVFKYHYDIFDSVATDSLKVHSRDRRQRSRQAFPMGK